MGGLEPNREIVTRQCTGTESSSVCSSVTDQGKGKNPYSHKIRQHYHSGSFEQDGGTKSGLLVKITKEIWALCLSKKITLTSEHLPGVQNTIADMETDK